jgi:methylmalonyl-CoA mutase
VIPNDSSRSSAPGPSELPEAPGFAEFPAPDPAAWRAEVERLLGGAPFEKKMRKTLPEGLVLDALSRREDVAGLAHLESLPGSPPFLRGRAATPAEAGPRLAPEIATPDPGEAARRVAAELAGGADAVALVLAGDGRPGVAVADLVAILADVDPIEVPVHVRATSDSGPARAALVAAARAAGADPSRRRGSATADPLGTLARAGGLPRPLPETFDALAETMRRSIEETPALAIARADGVPFHDGGADAVQELGYALASAIQGLRELDARGLAPEVVAPRLELSLAVGPRFFLEVAKLRAARLLAHRVLESCGLPPEARRLRVAASTSRVTRTATDPHVNLLRATTEALAAFVGGADVLHVAPFDDPMRPGGDDFSRRLARNVPLLLREEAHLGRVLDPAGGSWTVERLTADLAEAAWATLREVEAAGGLSAALAEGAPQRAIAATASARAGDHATRRSVLVGTNRYANAAEGSPPTVDAAAPPAAAAPAVAVEPIAPCRFGEPFEDLRRRVGEFRAAGGDARVFLAVLGPAGRVMPRLDFTASLFEVGGFEAARNDGFESAAAAARAAVEAGAPIVAVVGPDEAYPDGAPVVARAVKAARPDAVVVVAGLPPDEVRGALAAAGVDRFVHVRTDVLELLTDLADRAGAPR